jgi:hypothetical protein
MLRNNQQMQLALFGPSWWPVASGGGVWGVDLGLLGGMIFEFEFGSQFPFSMVQIKRGL